MKGESHFTSYAEELPVASRDSHEFHPFEIGTHSPLLKLRHLELAREGMGIELSASICRHHRLIKVRPCSHQGIVTGRDRSRNA